MNNKDQDLDEDFTECDEQIGEGEIINNVQNRNIADQQMNNDENLDQI